MKEKQERGRPTNEIERAVFMQNIKRQFDKWKAEDPKHRGQTTLAQAVHEKLQKCDDIQDRNRPITKQRVYSWFNIGYIPSDVEVMALAEVFGCKPSELNPRVVGGLESYVSSIAQANAVHAKIEESAQAYGVNEHFLLGLRMLMGDVFDKEFPEANALMPTMIEAETTALDVLMSEIEGHPVQATEYVPAYERARTSENAPVTRENALYEIKKKDGRHLLGESDFLLIAQIQKACVITARAVMGAQLNALTRSEGEANREVLQRYEQAKLEGRELHITARGVIDGDGKPLMTDEDLQAIDPNHLYTEKAKQQAKEKSRRC